MELAFIALGSNVGDRDEHLAAARGAIAALADTFIVAASDIEETDPLGGLQQEKYLNQMLAVKTGLEPMQLLSELQGIERANGRTRGERWVSRTLDLDIVSYADVRISEPALQLPHPGLADRDFWQREIAQIEAIL
jgi:2-amino-4-hydroxy-6-hydroxymethyldihydropteridine diphosphokinase